MVVALEQLEIEYVSEHRLNIFKMKETAGGWNQVDYVYGLDLALQTTLDNEIFLQIWDTDHTAQVNLNQVQSFFFLERILECKGYYTFEGETPHLDERRSNCEEAYINVEEGLQVFWDLRELMLYWLSYGG